MKKMFFQIKLTSNTLQLHICDNKENQSIYFNKQPVEYIFYESEEIKKNVLKLINNDKEDKAYFKTLL